MNSSASKSERTKPEILIFAGSGASKAVSGELYPTTAEFYERTPDKIVSDELFRQIRDLSVRNSGGAVIDIEQILWQLKSLEFACNEAIHMEKPLGWLLQGTGARIAQVLGHGQSGSNNTSGTIGMIRGLPGRINHLTDMINEQVYEFYGSRPPTTQLNRTWGKLLTPLQKRNFSPEIFTTNYDLVIESALEELPNQSIGFVSTGWNNGVLRTLNHKSWLDPDCAAMLTKLHGSINWSRMGEDIHVGDPQYKGDHKKHAIIYPGAKGLPADPLFQSFHSHLRQSLSRCRRAIFIGFAFRDEYINGLCERYLPQSAEILLIDPNPKARHPFASSNSVNHLKTVFDAESALAGSQFLLELQGYDLN